MAKYPTCPRQGEYTYKDYAQMPDELGYRLEILDGFLVKEPSPSVHHQRILRELARQLMEFFDEFDPHGELFFAPLDVTLTDKNVLQPDIFFISGGRREIIRPERINGPCDLVIEIMSPTTRRRDSLEKMELYRKSGIPHYWLIDPDENTLEAFWLKDENYSLIATGAPDTMFCHPAFPGLNLDLGRVFRHPLP